jgi:hypothetical protein
MAGYFDLQRARLSGGGVAENGGGLPTAKTFVQEFAKWQV